VSGGDVGAQGMVTKSADRPGSGTNTKRSQIAWSVTSIALSLRSLGTQLLGLPAQSLKETSRTLTRVYHKFQEISFNRPLIQRCRLANLEIAA